jgi:hypothetical protein
MCGVPYTAAFVYGNGEKYGRAAALTGIVCANRSSMARDVSVSIRQFQTVGEAQMLEALAVILVALWILGLVTSYTLGGLIHVLLVVAIVVIVVRVIQRRRV